MASPSLQDDWNPKGGMTETSGGGHEPPTLTTSGGAIGRATDAMKSIFAPTSGHIQESDALWFTKELEVFEGTTNLDALDKATLFYLARLVKEVPEVTEVYVEEIPGGRIHHWSVIKELDFDAMNEIYEIEEDTIDRFPRPDLSFRVTVADDELPEIPSDATVVFESD